jgi:hypothetical protein
MVELAPIHWRHANFGRCNELHTVKWLLTEICSLFFLYELHAWASFRHRIWHKLPSHFYYEIYGATIKAYYSTHGGGVSWYIQYFLYGYLWSLWFSPLPFFFFISLLVTYIHFTYIDLKWRFYWIKMYDYLIISGHFEPKEFYFY